MVACKQLRKQLWGLIWLDVAELAAVLQGSSGRVGAVARPNDVTLRTLQHLLSKQLEEARKIKKA